MKRFACLLLALALVAGCRRTNPEKKQPPVQVDPRDQIKAMSIEDSAKDFPMKKKN
jgi:hypothetical protein